MLNRVKVDWQSRSLATHNFRGAQLFGGTASTSTGGMVAEVAEVIVSWANGVATRAIHYCSIGPPIATVLTATVHTATAHSASVHSTSVYSATVRR